MLSIAVQFEELSITRTASITDEKLGVVMTMKIDAAEVAKVFSDLKLPAAFKAYEQQLGDPGAMKLDFGDRVALILRAELASRTQKRIQRRIKESGICDSMVGLDNTILLRTEVWTKPTCGSWPDANGSLQRNLHGY